MFSFCGLVQTVKTFEDNALIKQVLPTPGDGAVLVVDGGGSLRCALVGDVIAGLGQKNRWAGLVIWGAVRDTAALAELDLGLKALGSNPWKSVKSGSGLADVPVSFGGVTFSPGDWLYSRSREIGHAMFFHRSSPSPGTVAYGTVAYDVP